jgi:hypothetical protein
MRLNNTGNPPQTPAVARILTAAMGPPEATYRSFTSAIAIDAAKQARSTTMSAFQVTGTQRS